MNSNPHISVCVCTFQRPTLLLRLLTELNHLETQGEFTFSVVVTDNDADASARSVIEACLATVSYEITYVVESRRGIAHARNSSLGPARGEFVAFIDDDEFPRPDWLLNAYRAWTAHNVGGVLGPVRSDYAPSTPAWVEKSGIWERGGVGEWQCATGHVMPSAVWCRTGNVLILKRILEELNPVFRPEMGASGSDVDMFQRLMDRGHKFIWCNEAIVYEVVPPGRCKRIFMIRRALLRGAMSWRRERCWRSVGKAMIAVPLYGFMLPILLLRGHHLFMRYVVKSCDHLGRLLAAFGLDPVRTRDMQ